MTTDRPRLLLAAAGVLTGVAGLAVSLATAAALHERLDPPTAVAEAVVDVTPGRAAKALIDLVGDNDKPLLIAGVVVGLLALSALGGVLTARGRWQGFAVFVGMGLVAGVAVATRPNTGTAALLPVVLGTLTWLAVLPLLILPLRSSDAEGRRRFLVQAGVVAAGAAVVGIGSRFLGRRRRVVEEARADLELPVTDGVVPEGADLEVAGLVPWRVANEDFYRIDTALVVPAVEVDTWRLRVHGMVERELTLTFDDLLDRRLTEAWLTLTCVSNPVGQDLIGNAWWSGVRVADVLAEAGPLPGADAVLQTSEDGWTCGTPLEALTDDRNALLAVAMNGEPLPLEHGFPVRMVVPGLYGYVSATKWLVDLEVTRFDDFEAFWTERGWSPQGPVKTQSRIDVPVANHRVTSGPVVVAGVAWAQHTGVEAVEVRLDGGAWTPVELGRVPSVDTWVQWSGTIEVEPGVHTLAVRATDRSGYTQTGVQRDVVPDGATGWHTIEFTAE
ncbi:molybdopterin-dependent oxidoreductase [Nocardioides caldifontis]|uniref:molybdopterin-dependent oxidoreductase n=1 Tax=Nocardioides caldifontis TaxID=2588938 RepID=UPI001EF0BADA|nr:molybdopterin-dependent oxidoreductase [Nocardioides caldifontis]